MKSLEELRAIKEKTRERINADGGADNKIRVVVGMATCGIAAGARPVLEAMENEVAKRGIKDIIVTQTGCIGICQYEPVVEIHVPGIEKTTYIKMTPEKAREVINNHIKEGKPIIEYTIGFAHK